MSAGWYHSLVIAGVVGMLFAAAMSKTLRVQPWWCICQSAGTGQTTEEVYVQQLCHMSFCKAFLHTFVAYTTLGSSLRCIHVLTAALVLLANMLCSALTGAHSLLHVVVAVLMSVWELYTGRVAFQGMHYGQVGRGGMRQRAHMMLRAACICILHSCGKKLLLKPVLLAS